MTLPSHADSSLGPPKVDESPVPDRTRYWSASEWNAMCDAIIADATSVAALVDLAYLRKTGFREVQDFVNGRTGTAWEAVVAGAGAAASVDLNSYVPEGDAGLHVAFGAELLTTGTTATGSAAIHLGAGRLFGAWKCGRVLYDAVVYIPDLSAGAQEFKLYAGLLDTIVAGVAPNYGLWFGYDRAVVGAKWYTSVIGEDGTFTDDSGITVAAAAWTRLSIVLSADSTTVLFYINDVLVNTETGNTSFASYFGPGVVLNKTVGITARTVSVDLCAIDIALDTTTRR